jgi:hypothetical protein
MLSQRTQAQVTEVLVGINHEPYAIAPAAIEALIKNGEL